jgi:hypothetical protein
LPSTTKQENFDMSTNNISFTIPLERSALIRTAEYLQRLSDDLSPGASIDQITQAEVAAGNLPPLVSTTAVDDQLNPDPVAVFGDPKSTPTVGTATEVDGSIMTETSESASVSPPPPPPPQTETPPVTGVDLDSEGLPWDARIHSSAKTKLARGNTWKVKRGTDPALVESVKAELRQLMAVPAQGNDAPVAENQPSTTVSDAGQAPPPPPPPQTQAETTPPPPPPPAATGVEITFPILMQKITAGGISKDAVDAACTKHGVLSIPLLAARPDLIPAVHAELFPQG